MVEIVRIEEEETVEMSSNHEMRWIKKLDRDRSKIGLLWQRVVKERESRGRERLILDSNQ